jgi:hypothetical protein
MAQKWRIPEQVSARINQLSVRFIHIEFACNTLNMLILLDSCFKHDDGIRHRRRLIDERLIRAARAHMAQM